MHVVYEIFIDLPLKLLPCLSQLLLKRTLAKHSLLTASSNVSLHSLQLTQELCLGINW